ncbi:MAG TPA: hypothetical protein VF151_06980, partial [Gemmatimonadales bacterium]
MPAPSRSLRRLLRAAPLLAALALTDCLAAGALAAQSAMPAAADTFLLYKVGNQIGLETASRTSSGRGSELVSSFEFSDRGTRVP